MFWAWPALHDSLQYRRDWSNEATAHFRDIQQGANTTQLDIGNELSIFIADTRVNRERGSGRFMAAVDFSRLVDWISDLQQPGVLVLGQPLLHAATSELLVQPGGLVKDHNLPYFTQFDDLAMALRQRCHHDLIIVAGDVHFGRIARFSFEINDIEPVYFHEVVSSGMTVLPSARNLFEIHSDYRGAERYFPPRHLWTDPPGSSFSQVDYLRAIPPQEAHPGAAENHFGP